MNENKKQKTAVIKKDEKYLTYCQMMLEYRRYGMVWYEYGYGIFQRTKFVHSNQRFLLNNFKNPFSICQLKQKQYKKTNNRTEQNGIEWNGTERNGTE